MKKSLCSVVMLIGLLVMYGLPLAGAVPISSSQSYAGTEKVRAFHFVLRLVSPENARRMVDIAHDAGLNTVQVSIADGVQLVHSPWSPLPDAWSKADFKAWVVYVKSKGMEVVPEFQFLTHQEKFFQNRYPGLMFNSSTYDPRKEETYQQVFPLLDEVIELIHPRAIHIGHDEVAGRLLPDNRTDLRAGEVMLPAKLFLQDVLRIHDYLKKRGIETWMWGDMLISTEEFPEMFARELHGGSVGYGKALRNQLPRDIVICDWHYVDDQPDFTSLAAMQAEGFRVIGTTWNKQRTIRNFSHYAAQQGAYGMMATTWAHVQHKEWDKVERIIRDSGEAFRKDFPDAK